MKNNYIKYNYKYNIYTVFIPSFNGEWTFIIVYHKEKFIIEPECINTIPDWIRRGIRTLESKYIDKPAITFPCSFIIE